MCETERRQNGDSSSSSSGNNDTTTTTTTNSSSNGDGGGGGDSCTTTTTTTTQLRTHPLLVSLGNPLLDITAVVKDNQLHKRYQLPVDGQLEVTEQQRAVFSHVMKEYQVEYTAGGCALNSSRVFCWVLGEAARVVFVGGIGKDQAAQTLANIVQECGVITRFVHVDDQPTGVCVALVLGACRCLCADIGAAATCLPQHVFAPHLAPVLEEAKFIYVEGYFITHSFPATLQVARYAQQQHKTLVFNLCGSYVCENHPQELTTLLPYVDILFGFVEEYRTLDASVDVAAMSANHCHDPHNITHDLLLVLQAIQGRGGEVLHDTLKAKTNTTTTTTTTPTTHSVDGAAAAAAAADTTTTITTTPHIIKSDPGELGLPNGDTDTHFTHHSCPNSHSGTPGSPNSHSGTPGTPNSHSGTPDTPNSHSGTPGTPNSHSGTPDTPNIHSGSPGSTNHSLDGSSSVVNGLPGEGTNGHSAKECQAGSGGVKQKLVVVTKGPSPLLYCHRGEVRQRAVPPISPEAIVDTTGAGDSFVGGFLAALSRGRPLAQCLDCGVWTAQQLLRQKGCTLPPYPADFLMLPSD